MPIGDNNLGILFYLAHDILIKRQLLVESCGLQF